VLICSTNPAIDPASICLKKESSRGFQTSQSMASSLLLDDSDGIVKLFAQFDKTRVVRDNFPIPGIMMCAQYLIK
jgi:hypothetical protein